MRVPVQQGVSRAALAPVAASPAGGPRRIIVVATVAALALLAIPPAAGFEAAPDALFIQVGSGDASAGQAVAGLQWDWAWPGRRLGSDRVRASWEVSIGRWRAEPEGATAWYTQVGITPALRYEFAPRASRTWFVEGGVGLNVITPNFLAGRRRFSTEFNFGDHLAVGWRANRGPISEVALRVQHFSNAGIDSPNPGQNFLQLRVAKSFGR